jgi:hypothetical protein
MDSDKIGMSFSLSLPLPVILEKERFVLAAIIIPPKIAAFCIKIFLLILPITWILYQIFITI